MVRGRLASIVGSASDATAMAAVIGAIGGGVIGVVGALTCLQPGSGIVGSAMSTPAGTLLVATMSGIAGVGGGAVVGAFEGIVAYAFVNWCADRRRPLAAFAWQLGAVLALLNLTLTALAVQVLLQAHGESWGELWAPFIAAVATFLAVGIFAAAHRGDWPETEVTDAFVDVRTEQQRPDADVRDAIVDESEEPTGQLWIPPPGRRRR